MIFNIHQRALVHDASKLEEPEKSAFDRATPNLKSLAYGSGAYYAALKEVGPALQHHYAANDHHPGHNPVRRRPGDEPDGDPRDACRLEGNRRAVRSANELESIDRLQRDQVQYPALPDADPLQHHTGAGWDK